jgi:hypothetical protein
MTTIIFHPSLMLLFLDPGSEINIPDPQHCLELYCIPSMHCCGSGYIIQRYGSGSFYHQAKIVRKTLIPTVLCLLYNFLSLKNDVNVLSKSNKQKNLDLDPYQNVTDLQHCLHV